MRITTKVHNIFIFYTLVYTFVHTLGGIHHCPPSLTWLLKIINWKGGGISEVTEKIWVSDLDFTCQTISFERSMHIIILLWSKKGMIINENK